jgi:undecaprenyl diphosphate synthase
MPDKTELDTQHIPQHIAIIMDGNGRWAEQRGLPRIVGHKNGVKSVHEVVTAAREQGIKVLTLYAFSTENWQRPQREVQALMALLKTYLQKELDNLIQNDISLRCIGQKEKLPQEVRDILDRTITKTAGNTGLILNLALSYGGRSEIIMAVKALAKKYTTGALDDSDITEEIFSQFLYTAGLPDPDLLIRTGGEYRLSNFLLWQVSYSELYITEILWPDFKKSDLIEAIREFHQRQRRFGKTSVQIEK